MIFIRGSQTSIPGCEEEVRRWWRMQEERDDREMDEMETTRELEMDFAGQVEEMDTSPEVDTSVIRNASFDQTSHLSSFRGGSFLMTHRPMW